MEGKRNNKIHNETKVDNKKIKRIRRDLDYLNVIQLRHLNSKYLLTPQRILWNKDFYKDLTNFGYSVPDQISQYQIQFPNYSIKPSTVRNLIKMQGIKYYHTKWAPPRIKQPNLS